MEKRIPLGKKGVLVIADREFKGRHYIDVRLYTGGSSGNDASGNLFPTTKGVTFGGEVAAEVSLAILEAAKALAETLAKISVEDERGEGAQEEGAELF